MPDYIVVARPENTKKLTKFKFFATCSREAEAMVPKDHVIEDIYQKYDDSRQMGVLAVPLVKLR